MSKYQIYKDNASEYRWRYVATNTNIIADSGEGYTTKVNCQHGIDIMKASSNSSVGNYQIYKDARDEYRWRFRAVNGQIISDSGEGYVRRSDCERGIEIMKASSNSSVEDTTVTKNAYGGRF